MSSYKNNSNRIPRGSVAISSKKKLIKTEDIVGDIYLTEEDLATREKKSALEIKEDELKQIEEKLTKFQLELEEERRIFVKDKENFIKRLKEEEEIYERNKRRDYYEMREFMWENALMLAEDIVNQKIASSDFSMLTLFIGMIKKLPIAFEELTITVHPKTLEMIKEENSKAHFIMENIHWKFDYGMAVGEFIIEEEKEYYDCRFGPIFTEIKRRIEVNNQEIRREDSDDKI